MKRQIITVLFIVCLFATSFLGLVKADNINLAVVPTDWRIGETWNAPTYLDTSVLHLGNDSIRMERGDGTKSREILAANKTDDNWLIYVNPGDHIVFSVYMKTNASSIGDTTPNSGIRLGIDFSNSEGRINGVQSPDGAYWTLEDGFPTNQYLNFVNWGSDWTLRTMDFVVPSQYPSDGFGGWFPAGQLETPMYMTPWVQVWSDVNGNLDTGIGWFADVTLYINPESEPTPTPSPTASTTLLLQPQQVHQLQLLFQQLHLLFLLLKPLLTKFFLMFT
jgi:hypothetical protein